jgi:hypothetical protein
MGDLFDKHERPDVAGCADADLAWAACEAYEDYAYRVGESLSDDCWDRLISDVRAVYDEYYTEWE